MCVDELESALRETISSGKRVAAIVATMGTTDAFGLDDLEQICLLRDRLTDELDLDYRPHVHADAVIGWAWSVFNDYDIETNELQFPNRTVRAIAGTSRRIRHLCLADSLGVDYHKTGYAPYISSAVLVRDAADFGWITRSTATAPYIFQIWKLIIRDCTALRHLEAVAVRWRRSPTCCSSARTACDPCWGTSLRCPNRCAIA